MIPISPSNPFIYVRDLTPADFARPPAPPVRSIIQRLTLRHHAAARMKAAGFTNKEIALQTNYSEERIVSLSNDPAFSELVAKYAAQIAEKVVDEAALIQKKLLILADESLTELLDRFDDPAQRRMIRAGTLLNIMADALGRTVAPMKQAQINQSSPTKIIFNMGQKEIKEVSEEGMVIDNDEIMEIKDAGSG